MPVPTKARLPSQASAGAAHSKRGRQLDRQEPRQEREGVDIGGSDIVKGDQAQANGARA